MSEVVRGFPSSASADGSSTAIAISTPRMLSTAMGRNFFSENRRQLTPQLGSVMRTNTYRTVNTTSPIKNQ